MTAAQMPRQPAQRHADGTTGAGGNRPHHRPTTRHTRPQGAQMKTLTDIQQDFNRKLANLQKTVLKRIADNIAAVNDKTRRASNSFNFAAAGSQDIAVTWSSPFPDTVYGVWVTAYTTNPGQIHWTPNPATKTASGISITVVAASGVGTVTLDVLAVRSA